MALAGLTYAITRFTIEFLRDDEVGQFGTMLTISQWISIVMFVFSLAFAAWLSTQPMLRPMRRVSKTREPVAV
jgi:phosphatidylglycerol:prolipoprotein diacylglycerol transferase